MHRKTCGGNAARKGSNSMVDQVTEFLLADVQTGLDRRCRAGLRHVVPGNSSNAISGERSRSTLRFEYAVMLRIV